MPGPICMMLGTELKGLYKLGKHATKETTILHIYNNIHSK